MTRPVAIRALPGVQLLDVSGPLDVFAEANLQAAEDVYRLQLVATIPGEIRCSSGARLVPDRTIRDLADESIDTLIVAGCPNAAEIRAAPDVISSWLRKMAPVVRRYGPVCTGTFFLAETGCLTASMSPPTRRSPANSPKPTRRSSSTRTRFTSGTASFAPPPASPPVSTWPWRWSKKTWDAISPSAWLANS